MTHAGLPPFPWAAALHFALGLLRLSPSHFWEMTPKEFLALSGGLRPQSQAIARAALDSLMRQWPDGGEYGN